METKTILKIVLSSPGDVDEERRVMETVIEDLNRGIADERNLRLELIRWETDAYPGFHPQGPQGLIDPVLNIRNCDILLGIFWKRFGTPTKDALSGTEYEFKMALESWKESGKPQIMMYFKDAEPQLKTAAEHQQYAMVLRFKEEFPKQGLYWPFENELDFERKARSHLTHYILRHIDPSKDKPVAAKSIKRDQQILKDHCRNLQQQFSTINLFGETYDNTAEKQAARERITDIDSGFIPLHLTSWQESGAEQETSNYHIEELFFSDKSFPHFLLRGLPGSGKTTLLRYIAYHFASRALETEKEYIPVYMRLKSLDLSDSTLEEFIRDQINADSLSKESYHILSAKDRFLESSMILLFDGLDEIEHGETHQKFAPALIKLARKYPRCKMIVTSRPIGLKKSDFPGFKHLDLLPLEPQMITDYLQKWFADNSDIITVLKGIFEERPRIGTLAANPFLLSMICFTYEKGGNASLIERRSELYANCTKYLLQRAYDPDREDKSEITLQKTLDILKDISLRFFLWQEADFPPDQVNLLGRKILTAEHLSTTEDVLNRVQRETGLIQRAREGFTFVHRSLWEYFTALALRDRKSGFVIRQAANPDWEEVVRLYAGLLRQDEDVVQLVKGLWNLNRPLALRVMTEVHTPAGEIIKPLIEQEEGNQPRLLLIDSISHSLPLIPPSDRKNLVNETLRILLIDCEEDDCEVIFHAQALLERLNMQPLAPGGLIYEIFDLEHAAERQQELLNDPANRFEWIKVKGGTFLMGDDAHDANEKPAHRVKVNSFLVSKHPVTNRLLSTFPFGAKYPNYGGESHPAIGNTWWEAYYFALWIDARLPTEAEWEYAARGGKDGQPTQYYFGVDPEQLVNHAWFGESGREHAHAVDETNPRTGKENLNPLGLTNMLGNVWEWCADWYGEYSSGNDDNPTGPDTGSLRVIRGGSWFSNARNCRSANRNSYSPGDRYSSLGFRLVRRAP
jgi:formylglycine-generating enzyme required for sulfatase activity